MACPSRDPSRPLTANQSSQLLALYRAGASSRETAVDIYTLPQGPGTSNPNIIGALRDKGLAESRARRVQGRGWTDYWLTAAGVEQAQLIGAEDRR